MNCEEIVISDEENNFCDNNSRISVENDEECILIDDTTIVEQKNEKENQLTNKEFSLIGMISDKNAEKKSLKERMDELDRLMALKPSTSKKKTSILTSEFNENHQTLTSFAAKKRKLTAGSNENRDNNLKKTREIEKIQKNEERLKKKEQKEQEKLKGKIEREIAASINSKAEFYTFCHIGKTILDENPGLETEIRQIYSDRKINDQIVIEDQLGARIEWRRKCIELKETENGKIEKLEYWSTQNLFAIVVKSAILKEVINSNNLTNFIEEQRTRFQNGQSTMIVVAQGKLEIMKKKLHQIAIKIFEKHRTQIVQIGSLTELAMFTAQYLRSLARREKKKLEMLNRQDSAGSDGHKIQYSGDKGITIGTRAEIVKDWWNKMLMTIDQLSDAQRRAIIEHIPDPIEGIDKFTKMNYSDAIQELGNIETENGRRIGAVMAHRIFTMLTDESGTAIID